MKYHIFLIYFFLTLSLISCSEKEEKISFIKEDNLEMQMIEAYNEGLKEFNRGDIFFAAKKFNEVELLYPQSIWAPRSTLMAAYVYYTQLYFTDTIIELERFLEKYPNHPNTDYAYYLMAISHYNQIVDEKKDLGEIIKAKGYFIKLIDEYPDTDFAEDANFKLELIEEVLASKELYLANYYLDREKWIPAMNRYKNIVNYYDTTIFIEEALYRLVELNYKLGLIDEAKKYTSVLGYNYQSSDWYDRSYKILNKDYEKSQLTKGGKKERSLIKKFKSLFE
ncbi:outer membrane protein assembly factor BamD [Pelagibacterales bacterium SAG-MED23]|nr:outer membrane protein assembly factor BamD [Pelagibacterales bacterium SAG-MED23]